MARCAVLQKRINLPPDKLVTVAGFCCINVSPI